MGLKECESRRLIKRVSVDLELISSLKKTSKNKEISAGMLVLEDRTYASIISLYYDSLRELLEAIVLKNGFKIYNHECYVFFIDEILKDVDFSKGFDGVRRIRNGFTFIIE